MQLFGGGQLTNFLDDRIRSMTQEVHEENKNKLLNVNESDYINYLVSKYEIEQPILYLDSISVSDREELLPAERFSPDFNVRAGQRYPKQVIRYHVPYSGAPELLRYTPSTHLLWSLDGQLIGNEICFDLINWRDNPDTIRGEAEQRIGNLQQQVTHIASDVQQYNNGLENCVREVIQARKTQHLKQLNLLVSLGVPFKKAREVPSTFAVPVIRKPLLVKPSAPSTPFTPEPALDDAMYNEVLRLAHGLGVEMERHPRIYQGKDEETLRDHFLLMLSPHFQSVTGETFNKSGKTDILIRHEKANVFVAECKFWGGAKILYKTIDQILGYLTWRDSKAAIFLFVRNKELSLVLKQIEIEATQHPCFMSNHGKLSDSWFNFQFHLREDRTRAVQVAIMCFHFPT